jgi:hypothetical protein
MTRDSLPGIKARQGVRACLFRFADPFGSYSICSTPRGVLMNQSRLEYRRGMQTPSIALGLFRLASTRIEVRFASFPYCRHPVALPAGCGLVQRTLIGVKHA